MIVCVDPVRLACAGRFATARTGTGTSARFTFSRLKYGFFPADHSSLTSISWAPSSRSHEPRLRNTPTTRERFFSRFIRLSSMFVDRNRRRWCGGKSSTARQHLGHGRISGFPLVGHPPASTQALGAFGALQDDHQVLRHLPVHLPRHLRPHFPLEVHPAPLPGPPLEVTLQGRHDS